MITALRENGYSPSDRHVTIVGAGVAGLCAAVRLRLAGLAVTVLEKNAGPGGRCDRIEDAGYRFDTGPTILLLPSVLGELFAAAGRRMHDYLTIESPQPNYVIHYADGSAFTVWRDRTKMRDEIERIEPGSFARYEAFTRAGRDMMAAAMGRFAVTHYDSLGEFLSPGVARDLLAARAYKTVASHVASYFRDPRLRMAFSFQTMYLGLSPYQAPAIYGLLPFTELNDGIFYPRGGLYEVPLALEKLARELGVAFEYGRAVRRLHGAGDRVESLELSDGETRPVDLLLCNADLPWAYERLIPERPLARRERLAYTSSGFMLYLGVEGTFSSLAHHSVFFGSRFRESFSELFDDLVLPEDLNFYVAAPSVSDRTVAPAGHTALYILVPVPRQSPRVDWSRASGPLRERVLDRLEATVCPGLRSRIRVEHVRTPDQWAEAYNLAFGSAFGLSLTLDQVGPFRPKNRDAAYQNLYFAGASTQPGTGIPLVAISAKLAVERMLREHRLAQAVAR